MLRHDMNTEPGDDCSVERKTRTSLPMVAAPKRQEASVADVPNLDNLPSVFNAIIKPENVMSRERAIASLKNILYSLIDLKWTLYIAVSLGTNLVRTLMVEILRPGSPSADDAADALVEIANFPEMIDCLEGCDVYQFLLDLSSAMPSEHVRHKMMQLISILHKMALPSEAPINNWAARRQYDSMLIRMYHHMAQDVFSDVWTLDEIQLLRLIRNVLSYRDRLDNTCACELLYKCIKLYHTAFSREAVRLGVHDLLKDKLHDDTRVLVAGALACLGIIAAGGEGLWEAVLGDEIHPKILDFILEDGTLSREACSTIRGIVKGGGSRAIERLERSNVFTRIVELWSGNGDAMLMRGFAFFTMLDYAMHADDSQMQELAANAGHAGALCLLIRIMNGHEAEQNLLLRLLRFPPTNTEGNLDCLTDDEAGRRLVLRQLLCLRRSLLEMVHFCDKVLPH